MGPSTQAGDGYAHKNRPVIIPRLQFGFGYFVTLMNYSFQFNDIVNVPFSSEAFVAGILAYFLDNTMHKDHHIRRDRGKHWWDKFRSFKTDTRSEEFYSLPFNLNKYFPSV